MTLVKHEAIPDGYMAEFVALANSCQRAAERQAAKGAKLMNDEAALILHNRQSELEREQKTLTMSENMFLQSIGDRPRAYRSKLQKAWYEGPNARRDAEELERTRWLSSLADIVAKSPTPMGRLLCSQPGNLELLGGGRRASTLRSRVRELRKFFAWFSVTYEEEFPTTEEHFTGFLRARASEPCNRGALKATHRSFGFLEEVTGMPLSERRTKSKLFDVILRELLSTALPGKPAQQAPRFPIKVLTAVESFVVDETKPAYMRMYAWWVLLQNWCTLRFSDHRGISPRTVQEGAGFWSMLLERPKTIGRDKNVQMRPLYLDAACFFQYPRLVRVWVETPQSAGASRQRLPSSGTDTWTPRLHQGRVALRHGVCHPRQTSCSTLRLFSAASHPTHSSPLLDTTLVQNFHAERHVGTGVHEVRQRLSGRMGSREQRSLCQGFTTEDPDHAEGSGSVDLKPLVRRPPW